METRQTITYHPARAQQEAYTRIAFFLSIFLNALARFSSSKSSVSNIEISANLRRAINQQLPSHYSGLPEQAGANQLSQEQQNALNYVSVTFMTKLAKELENTLLIEIETKKRSSIATSTNIAQTSNKKKVRSLSISDAAISFVLSNTLEKKAQKQEFLRLIATDYFTRSTVQRLIFVIRNIGPITNTTLNQQLSYETLAKYEEKLFQDDTYKRLGPEQLNSNTELFTLEELLYLIPFFSATKAITNPIAIPRSTRIPSIPTAKIINAYNHLTAYADAALSSLEKLFESTSSITNFAELQKVAAKYSQPPTRDLTESVITPLEQQEIECYEALNDLKKNNFSDALHTTFILQCENLLKNLSRSFRETRKCIENLEPETTTNSKEKLDEFKGLINEVACLNPQPKKMSARFIPNAKLTGRDNAWVDPPSFELMHSLFKPPDDCLPAQLHSKTPARKFAQTENLPSERFDSLTR